MKIRDAFTFDDVLLEPAKSAILPADTHVAVSIFRNLQDLRTFFHTRKAVEICAEIRRRTTASKSGAGCTAICAASPKEKRTENEAYVCLLQSGIAGRLQNSRRAPGIFPNAPSVKDVSLQ